MSESHLLSDFDGDAAPERRLTLHAHSVLMEDLLSAGRVEINAISPSPVALFANPFRNGQVEALVIDPSGVIKQLRRGENGWEQVSISPGETVHAKEVVTAVAPDGTVSAFYVNPGDTLAEARLTGPATWTIRQTGLGNWKNLRVTYSLGIPAQVPIIYSFSTGGGYSWLQVYQWQVEQWKYGVRQTDRWLHGTGKTLGELQDVVLYPNPSYFIAGRIPFHLFAIDRQVPVHCSVDWATGPPTLNFGQVYSLFDQTRFLIMGTPAHYMTLSCQPTLGVFLHITQVNGRGGHLKEAVRDHVLGDEYEQGVGMFDSQGMAHVYLVDKSGVASVLHQVGWASMQMFEGMWQVPKWQQATIASDHGYPSNVAVPIESGVRRLFVDTYPGSNPSLLIVRRNGDVLISTQERASGVWYSETVRLSSERPSTGMSAYRTQVTVVDEYGKPAANLALTVAADSRAQIRVADRYALVGPDDTVEIMTDAMGRVTFSTPAHGLTTPALIITSPELTSGSVLHPDAAVQRYLAGAAPLPLRPSFTGATLESATVDGKPGGKPVVNPSVWTNGLTPAAVVSSIGQVFAAGGAAPVRQAAAAGAAREPIGGFVIQRYDPARSAYRALATVEEIEEELGLLRQHPQYGGVLEEAQDLFGDLWEGVKRAGAKLRSALVAVADGVVQIAVWVGGKLVELGRFVINSMRDAAEVVMAVFNTLEAEIVEVVEWLRSRFNYKDTWDTMMAFDSGFSRLGPFLLDSMRSYGITPAHIKAKLDKWEAEVSQSLDLFAQRYAGSTFQDMVGADDIKASASLFAPDRVLFSAPGGSVTRGDVDGAFANWFMDLVMPHAASLTGGPTVPGFESLWEKFEKLFAETNRSFVTTLTDGFNALVNFDDPKAFGRLAVQAFVDLMKSIVHAVFQFVEFLADILLEIVTKTLESIGDFLNTNIDSPPVTALFNWFYDQAHTADAADAAQDKAVPPVTIGRLLSLMLAFPTTYAWKLAKGTDAPLFPGGKFPPSEGAAHAGASEINPYPLIGGIAQIIYGTPDSWNDCMGAEGIEESTVAAWVAWGCELCVLLCSFPNKDATPFVWPEGETVAARNARAFNWFAAALITLLDLYSLTTPDPKDPAKQRRLIRNQEIIGKVLMTVMGSLNLGAGIWECISVEDITKASIATNVLTPLSPVCQFMRIPVPTPAWLLGLKVSVNIASDWGGGAARVASAAGA